MISMHSFRTQRPNPLPIEVASTSPDSFVGNRDGQILHLIHFSPLSVSWILEIPVHANPIFFPAWRKRYAFFPGRMANIHRHHQGII